MAVSRRPLAWFIVFVLSLLLVPRPANAACECDCDGNNEVTVNELVTIVSIILETSPLTRCPSLPTDRVIQVNDLVRCVGYLLDRCPEMPTAALFNAEPRDPHNPFPTDRLRDDGGNVHVNTDVLAPMLPASPTYDTARTTFARLATELAALQGFSTWAPIRIAFDGPVPAPTAEEDGSILLVRYDDPATALPVTITAVTPETGGSHALELQPVSPLEAKTRYVYVVTKGLRNASGSPVQPSPALGAALSTTSPQFESWRAELDPILTTLNSELGIGLSDIAVIDFFTTQPTTDDLITIKDRLVDGDLPIPAPEFDDNLFPGLHTGTFAEGTPEFASVVGSPTSDTIAAVVIGTFPSVEFRLGPQQPFDPARVGGTVTPTVNHVPFYLTLPKGARPAAGYPLSMFASGLLNSGRDVGMSKIGHLAGAEPLIAISISAANQGERGDPYHFFNADHAFATRDNFRQTVADYLQLQRMIRSSTVTPFDMVDKDRIYFMGGSLGAMIGTLYLGVEPDVSVGMFSVPGSGLPRILLSSVMRGLVFNALARSALDIERNDPLYPSLERRLVQVLQWAWDPADPINTGPFLIDPTRRLPGVPAKRILMHEAVGDNFVPNARTDDLVLAMGLPDVTSAGGCMNAAGCSGVWRFNPADYGLIPGLAHLLTDQVPQAYMQAARFLRSGGTDIADAAP